MVVDGGREQEVAETQGEYLPQFNLRHLIKTRLNASRVNASRLSRVPCILAPRALRNPPLRRRIFYSIHLRVSTAFGGFKVGQLVQFVPVTVNTVNNVSFIRSEEQGLQ